MLTRRKRETKEFRDLAVFAVKSRDTKGRVYRETEHPYRTVYQRDKDRIIYSTAFRRLQYKTQVFVNHEGDYYRTRLTHTLEVTQIAKSIARALRLNEELVEAIALAHDLGHTPFGHAGEDALREIMRDHGGFDHNLQGVRVVEYLEKRYPKFRGLNLTHEVREGIMRHSTTFDHPEGERAAFGTGSPNLETQVVDIADEIAYDNHDLDDGVTSGLIDEKGLRRIPLWRDVSSTLRKKYPKMSDEIRKIQIVRHLVNRQVSDVIRQTERKIARFGIRSAADARRHEGKIVGFSGELERLRKPLRRFLVNSLYRNYRVVRMTDKATRFLTALFDVYYKKPEQLPPSTASRLRTEERHRVVCDYIAGMTDRYALDEYKKFFEPYERV